MVLLALCLHPVSATLLDGALPPLHPCLASCNLTDASWLKLCLLFPSCADAAGAIETKLGVGNAPSTAAPPSTRPPSSTPMPAPPLANFTILSYTYIPTYLTARTPYRPAHLTHAAYVSPPSHCLW